MEIMVKNLFKFTFVLCIIAVLIASPPVFAQEQETPISLDLKVGDIIQFGRYEQDNDLSNGTEEIEWRILAIEGNTALLMSVMGLDAKPYNEKWIEITWENCTLRSWLNNEFYDAAFNEEERSAIEKAHVANEDNPDFSTDGGNDTEDDVFLLSVAEALAYFRSREERKLKPTKYAIENGAWTNPDSGNGWWWLRSPGHTQHIASEVNSDGDISDIGYYIYYAGASVRPALRIKLGK